MKQFVCECHQCHLEEAYEVWPLHDFWAQVAIVVALLNVPGHSLCRLGIDLEFVWNDSYRP